MQNKIEIFKKMFFLVAALMFVFSVPAMAEDEGQVADNMSANAIMEYNVDGSIFQQITDMEQEKVLMQLEKERAQLDLELDRLAAEKIKLHMEIDTLSNNAEEQKKALEEQKAELAQEAAKLEQEKRVLAAQKENPTMPVARVAIKSSETPEGSITDKYKLIEIIGAGNQLQATIQDLASGQRKKVFVGKVFDDYTVDSISLDEGVVFEKDSVIETLNIGKEK